MSETIDQIGANVLFLYVPTLNRVFSFLFFLFPLDRIEGNMGVSQSIPIILDWSLCSMQTADK